MSKTIVITPELLALTKTLAPHYKALIWDWLAELVTNKEFQPDFGEQPDLDEVKVYQQLRSALKLKRSAAKSFPVEAATVIQYLNDVAGAKYRPETKSYVQLVSFLISNGHTVEEIKLVIENRAEEWRDTKYEQYLRPETLFGEKFQNYLHAATKQLTSGKAEPDSRLEKIRRGASENKDWIDGLFGGGDN